MSKAITIKQKSEGQKGEGILKKWIVIIILLVGAVGGGTWYFFKGSSTPVQAVQASTATVQKGKMEVHVSGSGSLESVTNADITAAASDTVDEVLVSAGDVVAAGQELVTFTGDTDPITAPAAGTITAINVAAGDKVQEGKVVAHVTNYNDLQVVVGVDELDISKVAVGQTATVAVSAFEDTEYTGTVTAVANEGTASNGVSTFNVTVHLDKSDNLKIGMTAEASILTQSKDGVLYVPIEAVRTRGDQKFVLTGEASTTASESSGNANTQAAASQKTVQTGISNDTYVEITEGLTEGETVQLPAVRSSSSTNAQQGQGMMMGGFGGNGNMSGRSSGMGGFNRQQGTNGGGTR